MTNLIDYILDLFRSPESAADFVANPDQALRSAGLNNVSPAQVQAVAATAAPAGVALGGGDPVLGLQRAVANHHGIESPTFFSPEPTFVSQRTNEFQSSNDANFASHNQVASNNDPSFASHNQVASNNDTSLLSPDQHSGANSQQGGFNLGFGDITLGDKTTQTATDGGVVVGGDSSGDIVSGDGAALGDGNKIQNGDINAGTGANVNTGSGDIDDRGTTATGGSDVIQGNDGPVIKDVDMSGGHGGAASTSGGGGLIGVGNNTEANGGGGGAAGGITINDSHDVGGNNTEVGGDVSGSGGIDNSRHDHQDNSDNSDQDNSRHDHQDNSDSHDATTHVDVDTGLNL